MPIRNDAKIGHIVAGVFVWIPLLWAAGPQEYPIEVTLEPLAAAAPAPAVAPTAPVPENPSAPDAMD